MNIQSSLLDVKVGPFLDRVTELGSYVEDRFGEIVNVASRSTTYLHSLVNYSVLLRDRPWEMGRLDRV